MGRYRYKHLITTIINTTFMTKQDFINLFADRLGITETGLTEDTELASLLQWDSYGTLDTMVLADEIFHVDIPADEFKKMKTIGDLIAKIGNEHFE
jgi:acyl carrier protein